ncbi:MAG: coniferyl aldehyde dehydrogenase [Myxococcaceae bacterium]
MNTPREAYERLRRAAVEHPFPTADERDDRLARLEKLLVAEREVFVKTIDEDFGGRSRAETLSADVLLTLDGVRYARKHLREWMKKKPATPNPLFLPSRAWVEPLPRGVVAVIAPWNYPVNLALGPLACALAAGNRVLIKPSEVTPRTAEALARAISDHFSADEVAVVTGGADVSRAVTELPLDGLLFTGSTQVGRLVAQAAAKNLVPVTLELGGKSPALIHPGFDLKTAADRLVVGKLFNGGQTCIAPDYVLVKQGDERRLVQLLREAVEAHYPRAEGLTSIVNERMRSRLDALVADAVGKGAQVEQLGAAGTGRVMTPVALLGVTDAMTVMQEEIFGPVLPIETYSTLDEAISRINARPKPLAFYYFDDSASRAEQLMPRVSSGGAVLNDCLVHFAQEALPFGGVGASGLGAYHGEAGFETFSHARSVLAASPLSAARNVMKPPYGTLVDKALEALIRRLELLRR